MAGTKRWYDRSQPTITSGGSANAQTLTYTVAPTALHTGDTFSFIAGFTNTGALTLDVGLGAVNVAYTGGGEVRAGEIITVSYTGSNFQLSTRPSRIRLYGNITFYVSTTGSDSHNGTNSSTQAWLTLQHALDWIHTNIDLNGYNVTIKVADGTYTGFDCAFSPAIGLGSAGSSNGAEGMIALIGNTTTPANVVINGSGGTGHCAFVSGGGNQLYVNGVKFAGSQSGLVSILGALVEFNNCEFGTITQNQIGASLGGAIFLNDYGDFSTGAPTIGTTPKYTISGSAATNISADFNGLIDMGNGGNVTLSGTPAFGTAFVKSSLGSTVYATGMSYSGSATGVRYSVGTNANIWTSGGGASYFPGGTSGSSGTGGQYN